MLWEGEGVVRGKNWVIRDPCAGETFLKNFIRRCFIKKKRNKKKKAEEVKRRKRRRLRRKRKRKRQRNGKGKENRKEKEKDQKRTKKKEKKEKKKKVSLSGGDGEGHQRSRYRCALKQGRQGFYTLQHRSAILLVVHCCIFRSQHTAQFVDLK